MESAAILILQALLSRRSDFTTGVTLVMVSYWKCQNYKWKTALSTWPSGGITEITVLDNVSCNNIKLGDIFKMSSSAKYWIIGIVCNLATARNAAAVVAMLQVWCMGWGREITRFNKLSWKVFPKLVLGEWMVSTSRHCVNGTQRLIGNMCKSCLN